MDDFTMVEFVAETLNLGDALAEAIAADLACSGALSGTLDGITIDGEPFWDAVERVENETGRDLTSEARELYS